MTILLLMVDADETTPLGIYPNWRKALAAASANAFDPNTSSSPLEPEFESHFMHSFDEAFEPYERATSDEGMDLTFESGGDWDYRLVQVEVFA